MAPDTTKRDLIILEGANGSGKSTIFKALQRDANYQLLVLDRFTGSHIVYDSLFNRSEYSSTHYFEIEEQLKETFNPLIVYLTAPISVLARRNDFRAITRDDAFDKVERLSSNLFDSIKAYNKYLNLTPLDKVVIDTSEFTVVATVRAIIHCLETRRF